MKITTKDIARLAGVSRGTVDRALNDRGQIAPEMKAKILKIAASHGYVKNVLASSLAKGDHYNISIVLPDPEEDVFWLAPLEGIKKLEAFVKNYGLELNYHFFKLQDSDSYTHAVGAAVRSKPAAILTAPVFLRESTQSLQIAQQNGIPFVCINSEISQDGVLCYVGQNSYESGQLAGKLFQLSNNEKKDIAVVTLGHSSNNATHINKKIIGLRDYIDSSNSDLNINEYLVEDFLNPEKLVSCADDILKKSSDLKGIFFTNSRAYLIKEFTQLFENLSDDVTKIGFDLIPENIALLQNGRLDFIFNQNPQRQGYLGIMNLFNHFIYKKDIPKKRYLPIDIIVKENYENYVSENEFNLDLVFQ